MLCELYLKKLEFEKWLRFRTVKKRIQAKNLNEAYREVGNTDATSTGRKGKSP